MDACKFDDPYSKEIAYIIRLSDSSVAGTFHIHDIHWKKAQAEIGYGLHYPFTGKGIATKSVLQMEVVLQKMGFQTIIVGTKQWNQKSWAVAERAAYSLQEISHKGQECAGCDDCDRIYRKKL